MQVESCTIIDEYLKQVIEARIIELMSSPVQSTIEFPPFLKKTHRDFIHKLAKLKGLYSVTRQRSGVKCVKVGKELDSFVKLAPSFRLTDLSKKMIFHCLKTHKTLYDEAAKISDVEEDKPKIPVYRFCAGTINDDALLPPPKSQNKFAEDIRRSLPIYQYKPHIIETIRRSQVTVLCSDLLHGRISEVPQFLLEECHQNNRSCRIICALAHKTAAVFHSEIVSAQRGERLGLTVGYQIHLESMSSMSTNLLYTTGNFFLRCLMANNKHETFSAITHVILDDIGEMEPFGNLLLHELRQALPSNQNLKVILMCSQKDVDKAMSNFKEATLFKMNFPLSEKTIYHLEEILYLINHKTPQNSGTHAVDIAQRAQIVDELLAKCMESGSEDEFQIFIKLLREQNVDINVQHTRTKITLAIAAARHDQINYLMVFASLGGDLSCRDIFNKSAFDWAQDSQSELCLEFLREKVVTPLSWKSFYSSSINQSESNEHVSANKMWTEEDREMVYKIINYIHFNTGLGAILVLLPTFSQVAKQDFLLKQKVAQGEMPNDIKAYLLHTNTQLSDYRLISQMNDPKTRKVILSIQLPMSLLAMEDIVYVIDSGLISGSTNCNFFHHLEETSSSWISRECAIERTSLPSPTTKTFCFRLYSKRQYESFEAQRRSVAEKILLKNECLFAKLLKPEISIREYMHHVEEGLCSKTIDDAINKLQEIGALDETESVTTLGIRLVDIPIDTNLAKVLLFGIVLQCLDPVLTIVSILSHQEPSVFLDKVTNLSNPQLHLIDEILSEEGSDHLIMLRLYQNWIERAGCNEILLTESNYVLNAELEIISSIRSQLIGILRAAGLIQSSGTMNIHFINQHSNDWSMVKAAFIGGMYPNICRMEQTTNKLMSKQASNAIFHEKSALNNCDIHAYQTNWVLCQQIQSVKNREPILVCNTLITPTSLSLFAGSLILDTDDIVPLSEIESDSESEEFDACIKQQSVRFIIDEWLSFLLYEDDAYLLMEMRQKLYCLFNDVMRVPEDIDKFRKAKHILNDKFRIIESIANLLQNEDEECKLPQPKRIGDRPNAFSSKFTKLQDKIATLKNNMLNLSNHGSVPVVNRESDSTSKSFFVVKISSRNHARRHFQKMPVNTSLPVWREIIFRYHQFPTVNIIIFLMLDDSDLFCGTAQLCFDGELYFLNEVASRDVSVNELKALYFTNGEYFPGCFDGQELSFDIGKRLFDLFL